MSCSVDGCLNEAARAGLCWSHVKRRSRKLPVNVELEELPRSPFDRLLQAAFVFSELVATDDAGWKRARDNLRKSAVAYVAALLRRQLGGAPRE